MNLKGPYQSLTSKIVNRRDKAIALILGVALDKVITTLKVAVKKMKKEDLGNVKVFASISLGPLNVGAIKIIDEKKEYE